MTELTASPYAGAASLALLHFLWEGAVLAAGAVVMLTSLSKSGAQARYTVACGFLGAMLLAPVVTFVILLPAAPAAGAMALLPSRPAQLSGHGALFRAPAGSGLLPYVLLFWAMGVALFAIRAAGGWSLDAWQLSTGRNPAGAAISARVRELASRLGIRQAVRVFESSRAAVPVVFGALRPMIVLPASAITGLPPAQLEAILAHELAHIARHDFAVNCLQSVVEVLLFYHPAVWWLSSRIRQERELCCDSVAAALCGDRVAYSRALLALEEHRQEFAVAATGGNLKNRIERLLQQPVPARRAAGLVAFLAVAATIAAVFSTAVISAAPERQEKRHISDPVREQREDRLRKELETGAYDRWVTEDVAYIITAEERARWETLKDDAERKQFIEQFWLRRDPDPSTPKNEVREEHYRRISYANERFPDDRPGWRTDRGRIYIVYGPPDEAEVYPTERCEIWRYSDGRVFEFSGERYQLNDDTKGEAAITLPGGHAAQWPILEEVTADRMPEPARSRLRERLAPFVGRAYAPAMLHQLETAARQVEPRVRFRVSVNPATGDSRLDLFPARRSMHFTVSDVAHAVRAAVAKTRGMLVRSGAVRVGNAFAP